MGDFEDVFVDDRWILFTFIHEVTQRAPTHTSIYTTNYHLTLVGFVVVPVVVDAWSASLLCPSSSSRFQNLTFF